MIKTITLTGSEQSVAISGANCSIRNDGTEIIYASAHEGITAGADGVMSIPAGGSAALYDTNGTVYLLGTGSVLLVGSDYNDNPFKSVSTNGSGSGADEVARTAISQHAGNAGIHVTADEKAAWDAKADPDDIPTTLPADGGNSDTVGGVAAGLLYQYIDHGSTETDALSHLVHGVHRCAAWTGLPAAAPHPQGLVIALNWSLSDEAFCRRIYISPNQENVIWVNTSKNYIWSGWDSLATSSELAALEARVAALEGGA